MIKTYLNKLKRQASRGENIVDMLWCALIYGASPNNYSDFGFKNLSASQRATYVTNGLSRKIIRRFNDPKYIDIFEDKTRFAERFSSYFGREWIASKAMDLEKFLSFVDGKDKFIYKPIGNAQGMGIVVFDDLSEPEKVYKEVLALGQEAILEAWIEQHEALSEVYAQAINCLRIITFRKDDDVHFLAGGVTWGNGKKIANASASGIVSPVNFDTGILEKPAADFSGSVYEKHPITGVNMVGMQLPYWEETKQMLKNAAKEIPQVAYIGWDIAITPNGPVLIEGNTTPGYRYYQIPAHMENKTGNRKVYTACLK